jgi:hypothetical protein
MEPRPAQPDPDLPHFPAVLSSRPVQRCLFDSVADWHRFDGDPDPIFQFDAYPEPDPDPTPRDLHIYTQNFFTFLFTAVYTIFLSFLRHNFYQCIDIFWKKYVWFNYTDRSWNRIRIGRPWMRIWIGQNHADPTRSESTTMFFVKVHQQCSY